MRPLYDAVIALGRDPHWYRDGKVPDTIDGRFDMIAALFAILLLRFEQEGHAADQDSVLLTELFIDDMDGSLRQIGIGDLVVGKHVGNMMGALGGRLSAFREGFAPGGDLHRAVVRNIFREAPPSDESVRYIAERLSDFRDRLAITALERLIEGELPGA